MSGIADNPAYPVGDTVHPNGQIQYGFNGLTIREEFARSAMVGLLADPEDRDGDRAWVVVTPFDKHNIGDVVTAGVMQNTTAPFRPPNSVRRETCTEAVARLAVEHADALIAALAKPQK